MPNASHGTFAYWQKILTRFFRSRRGRRVAWALGMLTFGLLIFVCGCPGLWWHERQNQAAQREAAAPAENSRQADTPGTASPVDDGPATPQPSTPANSPSRDLPDKSGENFFEFALRMVYRTAQLFLMETGGEAPSNWLLSIARIAIIGMFVLGTYGAVRVVFGESFRVAWFFLRQVRRQKHIVVCGLGSIGMQLIRDLRPAAGHRHTVVAIEADEQSVHVDAAREAGALVLIGDCTDPQMLQSARVWLAEEIFAVTGSDASNIELAMEASRCVQEWSPAPKQSHDDMPTVYLHVSELKLARLFEQNPVLRHSDAALSLQLKSFNTFLRSAQQLVTGPLLRYAPAADEVAHYVLFGFGDLGQCVALQIARQGHFGNLKQSRLTIVYEREEERRRFLGRFPRFAPHDLRLKDVTPAMDEWSNVELRPADPYCYDGGSCYDGEQPQQGKTPVEYACNAEFVPAWEEVDAEEELAGLLKLLGKKDSNIAPRIIFCHDNDQQNFVQAYRLREKMRVVARHLQANGTIDRDLENIPIFVGLPTQPGLSQVLENEQRAAGDVDFIPFAQTKRCCSHDEITNPIVDAIARQLHEDYCRGVKDNYQRKRKEFEEGIRGEPPEDPSGNANIAEWETLSHRLRSSNREAAWHLPIKLRSVGDYTVRVTPAADADGKKSYTILPCTLDGRPLGDEEKETLRQLLLEPANTERIGAMEHNRSMAERLLSGWRYGRTKDRDRDVTPDLIPWEELEEEAKSFNLQQLETIIRILDL